MKNFFKLFTLVLVAGLVLSSTAWGQLVNENFDYPDGDSLNVIHGWTVQPIANYLLPIRVASPGLTYSGYPSSGIGNCAKLDTTGQDLYKSFASLTSGSVYTSALVNITKATATGEYFFHLSTANTTTFNARLWAKLVSGAVAFGISKSSTVANVQYTVATYSLNTTHLVVIKYTFNPSALDSVYLWINPDLSGAEPTPNIRYGHITDADIATISAVNIRQSVAANAPRLFIDGVRVATSWLDAPLPIQLASFVGSFVGNGTAKLEWETISEVNNYGFNIQRMNKTTEVFETIGFVAGKGEPSTYEYIDVQAGTSYRLEQIDNDGLTTLYGPIMLNPSSVGDNVPAVFALNQNYPNPFNPSTKISFSLANAGYTTLKVYNIVGKEVATLFNGNAEAGKQYVANFDAKNLSSGMYFYKLQNGNSVEVKKLTLVK